MRDVPTLGGRTPRGGGTVHAASGRFVDFEINPSIVLHPDYAQERADSLGGVARAADDLAHILGIEVERQKNAHLIDDTLNLDVILMLNQTFDNKLQKLLILFCHISIFNLYKSYSAIVSAVFSSATGIDTTSSFTSSTFGIVFLGSTLIFLASIIFWETSRLCTVSETVAPIDIQYLMRSALRLTVSTRGSYEPTMSR